MLRVAGWTVGVCLVLWLTLIEGPMWVTRWRMERLLVDFHSIQPNQTDWKDAQRLMTRWGKWGHHDGTCTEQDCTYVIRVPDSLSSIPMKLSERWQERIWNSGLPKAFGKLGWRYSWFSIGFAVEDGKIVRTSTFVSINVDDSGPPEHWQYLLGIRTYMRRNLRRTDYREARYISPAVLGSDEQLDLHPDYKVGRPDGCEGCEIVDVSYTPELPRAEVEKLTAFQFSCLTTWHPCKKTGELLPVGEGWNLYQEGASTLSLHPSATPVPCGTEVRARGRDAAVVLEVDPMDVQQVTDSDLSESGPVKMVRARVVRVLKGTAPPTSSTMINIGTFPGAKAEFGEPAEQAENLYPGRRAFVAVQYSDLWKAKGVEAFRCGVIDDTDANRKALLQGIAEDVPYRKPISENLWP